MRITWLPRARTDLSHARQYIKQHNSKSAQRVYAAIRSAVGRIANAPHLGRPGRVARTRELVVPHTAFIVAYSVVGDRLVILAVIHGAREWPEGLE
jgi:toxin ParE1/3/4